jgi:sugar lactone lactonase YvrE
MPLRFPSFFFLLLLSISAGFRLSYAQNYVSTYAGDGTNGFADGDTALCKFKAPFGLCIDLQGNLYIADNSNHRIRKISTDGIVTTLAGTGSPGYVDGPGASAQFNAPSDLCADANGNIYVSDFQNQYIRKITPDGMVSTIAGSGVAGYLDGPSHVAEFNYPRGICRDAQGNLFVADSWNHRIRKIDVNGTVTTLAGYSDTIGVQSPGDFKDGTDTAARFNTPCGMSIDDDGNLYLADAYNHRIRKITPEGVVTTVAGTGDIGSTSGGFEDGTLGAARFNIPTEVFISAAGHLYVSDTYNNRIRLVANDLVSTVAGNGTAGFVNGIDSMAEFKSPRGVVADVSESHLYLCDNSNHVIRKISFPGNTGVFSLQASNTFRAFPNPCYGTLTVSCNRPASFISVSNVLGIPVLTQSIPDPGHFLQLDLTYLKAGVYAISVYQDDFQMPHQELLIIQ